MDPALDILAFAPHPDDAELGCGGSLILAAQHGLRVGVADLTDGANSTLGDAELRQHETKVATKHLGLCQRYNLGLPDTLIGSDPSHRDPVVEVIRRTRPQVVLAPYWQDRHPDHGATGKLVRDAYFFANVAKVGEGAAHRPWRLYFYMIHHPFEPTFVTDISAVWDDKMLAIEAFSSQFRPADDAQGSALSQSDFLNFVEARSIYFGAMIGAARGEPFYSQGPLSMQPFPEARNDLGPGAKLLGYSVFSP